MREFKPIRNSLFTTRQQKIERLNFILMQLDEIKELVILNEEVKDKDKQKFMYMYANAASHVHVLHFYLKNFNTWEFIPRTIAFFKKLLKRK